MPENAPHAAYTVTQRTTTVDRFGRRRLTPSRQWDGYEELVTNIEGTVAAAGEGAPEDRASSPLRLLIAVLETAWTQLTGGGTTQQFENWLEQTVVVGTEADGPAAYNYLDSFDAFLIAAIQEVEELHRGELTPAEIETELAAIWQRTYAHAAAQEEARLATIWLGRGRAIKTRYPDANQRRRI